MNRTTTIDDTEYSIGDSVIIVHKNQLVKGVIQNIGKNSIQVKGRFRHPASTWRGNIPGGTNFRPVVLYKKGDCFIARKNFESLNTQVLKV